MKETPSISAYHRKDSRARPIVGTRRSGHCLCARSEAHSHTLPKLTSLLWREAPSRTERRLLRHLVGANGAAILSGRGARAWGRAVRRRHPDVTFHFPGLRELGVLDTYCAARGIRHIDLLRLDADKAQGTLVGAARLLRHSRIDMIAFGFASALAADSRALLERAGYHVQGRLRAVAIHERLLPLVGEVPKTMFDLGALCRACAVFPKGVVHVGAHEGAEWPDYERMGVMQALFVEANPAVFERLAARLGTVPGVTLAQCAIAAKSGTATLHVTSSDQSSSILPLHRHREHYPDIVESETIEVPARTLDDLIAGIGLAPERFNLLNIDIQGAELQALQGAERLLTHIAAINVEVNFEELYQGCAQVDELDDFLSARGFARVATICPFHKSWGDAFYVRL
jgi:FkbM family methyltransferase